MGNTEYCPKVTKYLPKGNLLRNTGRIPGIDSGMDVSYKEERTLAQRFGRTRTIMDPTGEEISQKDVVECGINRELSKFLGCDVGDLPTEPTPLPDGGMFAFRPDFLTRLIAGMESASDLMRRCSIKFIHFLIEFMPDEAHRLLPLIWTHLIVRLNDIDEDVRSDTLVLTCYVIFSGMTRLDPSVNDLREIARAHIINVTDGNFEQKGRAVKFFRALTKMQHVSSKTLVAEITASDFFSDICGMIDDAEMDIGTE
jgi:hypothetical protein